MKNFKRSILLALMLNLTDLSALNEISKYALNSIYTDDLLYSEMTRNTSTDFKVSSTGTISMEKYARKFYLQANKICSEIWNEQGVSYNQDIQNEKVEIEPVLSKLEELGPDYKYKSAREYDKKYFWGASIKNNNKLHAYYLNNKKEACEHIDKIIKGIEKACSNMQKYVTTDNSDDWPIFMISISKKSKLRIKSPRIERLCKEAIHALTKCKQVYLDIISILEDTDNLSDDTKNPIIIDGEKEKPSAANSYKKFEDKYKNNKESENKFEDNYKNNKESENKFEDNYKDNKESENKFEDKYKNNKESENKFEDNYKNNKESENKFEDNSKYEEAIKSGIINAELISEAIGNSDFAEKNAVKNLIKSVQNATSFDKVKKADAQFYKGNYTIALRVLIAGNRDLFMDVKFVKSIATHLLALENLSKNKEAFSVIRKLALNTSQNQ